MTLRVYITPSPARIEPNTGIGRVVWAQYKYLPEHGIELVGSADEADVVAAHANGEGLARIDVLHCHGLYWSGDPGSGVYHRWHHEINHRIARDARRARAITVPSDWVGNVFRRDMRIDPVVIGHGIDIDEWEPGDNKGYVLWNKNRAADVCDPTPAYALAERGVEVVATFAPKGARRLDALHVTGALPAEQMRELIRHAGIYLATTKETFGIGTLEAMACGVPVLGYRWGGTAEIVEHEVSGYLIEPGDIEGLVRGLAWLQDNRPAIAWAAQERATRYDWRAVIGHYAELYQRIADERATERHGVSVIITNHNYARWVGEAIASVMEQTHVPDELIVVDDGSTDESVAVIERVFQSYYEPSGIPVMRLEERANQGVAAARNAGIRAATQPYIICLDADDRLDPRYIETLLPAMTADPALGIAYTGLGFITSAGVDPSPWPPAFDWRAQTDGGVPPSNCIPCAAMFRRSMWERAGGYKQEYAPGEDAEFWTRGLSVGFAARRVTSEPLFHYRSHGGGAHVTRRYVPIDTWLPWMRDGHAPFAAPAREWLLVRSYSRPAVSVIVTQDAGAMLDRLLGQSVREWEAIVVGDAPLDACYIFARRAATIEEARTLARAPLILEATPETLSTSRALEIYLEEQVMAGCCGGNGGAAVLAAKRALELRREETFMSEQSDRVRMEFIGTRSGSVTFTVNGRRYRGGNNAVDKYANADPADVEGLERTGQWQRVRRPVEPVMEVVLSPAADLVEAVNEPRRAKGRRAG